MNRPEKRRPDKRLPEEGYLDPGAGVTLRPMTESDLDRVMEIAADLPTAPHWARSAYETAIADETPQQRVALVAIYAGVVIGFAIALLLAPEAEVETIAIESQAQGFGFGSALLQALLSELELAGATDLLLEVRSSNERALWFYREHGFRVTGWRHGYYADPVEDAVILHLKMDNELPIDPNFA